MKKIIFILLLAASTGIVSAYDFQVDGLCYNILTDQTNAVEVTSWVDKPWIGSNYPNLTIANVPDYVTYQDITYSVTSIGNKAFMNSKGLTSVTIPNSVTCIGVGAFEDCSSLVSVIIPQSVTSIGNAAFEDCSSMKSVTIPNSVTSVGRAAFKSCRHLTTVTIPNSVTTIRDDAFKDCNRLTSITISNSVTIIEGEAFSSCYSLTSITIPNSVTSIGNDAFNYCFGLTSITVESGNSVYDSRDNCNAIIETVTNTLIAGCRCTTIPNSVTSIGNDAFLGCRSLKSITIPNNVTSIGVKAFFKCDSLMSVTIPTSVTNIGKNTFEGCSGLTSIEVEARNTVYDSRDNCNAIIETATSTLIVGCQSTTIPNSVTKIGSAAFDGCRRLTSITIPNNVTSVGNNAFYSCSGLTSITCEAITPPTLGTSVFKFVDTSSPLYVPASSIPLYRKANQWKDFRNIQAIPGTGNVDLANGKSDLLMASKPVPEACIVFKGRTLKSNSLSVSSIVSPDFELAVRFENDTVCQADYRIVSFDLVIYNRTYSSDSDKMTSEQGTAIKKLKVGASITISSIVAIGPDDKQYNLEPIKLIIH